MTVYESSLPSMHLTGEDLADLEQLLKKDSTDEQFVFSFERDGFEYNLDSTQEFVNQADLPDKSKEYSIRLKCKEGGVRIEGKKLYSGGRLRISGEKDWVHKKERQLNKYIGKNKKSIRSHSSKIIGGVYALQIFGWFVVSTTVSTEETSMNLFEGVLAVGILVAFFGWPYALIGLVELVHPYHLIKRDESVRYRPKVKALGRYALLLLTVVGGIGGAVALIRFLT